MNIKKFPVKVTSLAVGATVLASLIVPFSVNAESRGLNLGVNLNMHASSTRLSNLMKKGDEDISARIASLENLNQRIHSMNKVDSATKEAIESEIKSNMEGLKSLKSKIDSDDDVTKVENDNKSIFESFRIFALVMPRGHIVASADRVNVLADMMASTSVKLQTRIDAASTAGKNVTALNAALTDMNAKIADSRVKAALALSVVVNLTPDQGDKVKLAANRVALKAARANLKIAASDLRTAREDAKSILKGLKAFNLNANASTTESSH